MPVCISGMHRSGTSMVTKVLHGGGLVLGREQDLMQAAEDNPEGYWENTRFVAVNTALLAAAGGDWDLPPAAVDWASPALEPLRQTAAGLVAEFAGSEPWGWKDPRNCLTIPFWEAVAGELRHVFVLRNPLEVASSLARRNRTSLAFGLALWRRYAEQFLSATRPQSRLVTHFDAFFADPLLESRRLLAFAGLDVAPAAVEHLARATVGELKHHTLGLADLLAAGTDAAIVRLYVALCQESGYESALGGPAARAAAGAVRPGGPGADGLHARGGGFDLWFWSTEERRRELETAVAIHEAARSELEGRITERDGMVLEREARIADRDAKIAERDRAIARQTEELAAQRQTLADQDRHLKALAARVEAAARHEIEQRKLLVAAHDQLLRRDAEVLATMGAALARTAPGAPAAIYYRQLVGKVRAAVEAHVPPGAALLVATYGDEALLDQGDRRARPFPRRHDGIAADYTDVDNDAAIAQLEADRAAGAEYLVVPSPAQAWLARQPELARHLRDRYPAVFDEVGTCTIYALRPVSAAGAGRSGDEGSGSGAEEGEAA